MLSSSYVCRVGDHIACQGVMRRNGQKSRCECDCHIASEDSDLSKV